MANNEKSGMLSKASLMDQEAFIPISRDK